MKCFLSADFLNADKELVYKDIGLSRLDEAGIQHSFLEEPQPEVTADQLQGADTIISLTPKFNAASFSGIEDHFLAVVRFGVGYDMVDVDACTEAGVALFITRGAVNHSVSEAIITWMLALSHRLKEKDQLVREGRWEERGNYMGNELNGRTLGLVGAGGIGSHLAQVLKGFGMKEILAFDPYLQADVAAERGMRLVDLHTLMESSDYVSVNCPLTDETRDLIGAEQLELMPSDAYLINTARGGIVNEAALFSALKEGRIAGAATDVFENEPADGSHPFAQLDNILLAPHCFAWTDELFARIGHMAADAVVQLSRGTVPEELLVNPDVLKTDRFQEKLKNHLSS